MARVLAFVPDLLFGSNVIGALQAAGHEAVLVSSLDDADPETVDVVVVDLTTDAPERIALVGASPVCDVPKLAFYAHVEADVRAQAEQAGFELVVPRSRMAREGAALVSGLSSRG
jgi:nucleoside-diphosphate-sugar epimerase